MKRCVRVRPLLPFLIRFFTKLFPTPDTLLAFPSIPLIHVVKAIDTAREEILAKSSALQEVSLFMFDHPELGYKEYKAHDKITSFLEDEGFEVAKHFLLPTAFKATYTHGKGGRTFGLNSELDALPEIGHGESLTPHLTSVLCCRGATGMDVARSRWCAVKTPSLAHASACGHPLIAVAGLAALLGLRAAMKKHDIDGTVVLLGTPAEEGGAGKVELLKLGGCEWYRC
jgi:metal-dependent amidase/aminoacylase/carboxypeptidase family protein